MFFDPLYWIVIAVGFALSLGAQWWVQSAVGKWSDVGLASGMSGSRIARAILEAEGIQGVEIEPTEGMLTDHYDPTSKTLRLSPDVHSGRSVTSAGIAAHEVGHALQDKAGYLPMRFRQKMVPAASIGTNLGLWIVVGGLITGWLGLAKIGVVLFGAAVVFTLVTLPVEFDASSRAREILSKHGLVEPGELEGVEEVLQAAAATYVAAAVTAMLQLLYWVITVFGRR